VHHTRAHSPSIILTAAPASGQRTMLASTSAIVKLAVSTFDSTLPTRFTYAITCGTQEGVCVRRSMQLAGACRCAFPQLCVLLQCFQMHQQEASACLCMRAGRASLSTFPIGLPPHTDLCACHHFEELLGDGPCGHPANGLPC